MPMFNDDFNWRPNNNSAKTNLRYTLEAEKWVNAVSAAQKRAQPRSYSKDFGVISMVFQLILCVALLILLGLLQLIKSLVFLIEKNVKKSEIELPDDSDSTNKDTMTKVDGYVETSREEPSFWKSIFVNVYGRPRMLWQFIYLSIFIFLIEIAMMFILGQYWPEHFRIYKDSLLVAGGISLFFAFTGL